MEIRDPVHGSIHIQKEEIGILSNRFFQRLRNIKQLGFSDYAFPGATHTRFIHGIGVMHIASKAFDSLFPKWQGHNEFARLRETLRLASLLHDIGHAPLSHATETVMPTLAELKIPSSLDMGDLSRQANHEDYTVKSIVDSSLTPDFKVVEQKYGVNVNAVAELVLGCTQQKEYFEVEGKNYFPLLHQLVSSEMDCDRMDYLLRDSYFCGVSYGTYDLDWIIDNLVLCDENKDISLGISERAIATFDDFLLSRFHMFLMVYFHYRSVCMEQMLYRYFDDARGEYRIPADIEQYVEHDDYMLKKVLVQSENKWARRIVNNDIPSKIFETFGGKEHDRFTKLENFLADKQIDYIKSSSLSRLSKYCGKGPIKTHVPMQVVRFGLKNKKIKYMDISEATDLFDKFSRAHVVNRLHCDMKELDAITVDEMRKIIEDE